MPTVKSIALGLLAGAAIFPAGALAQSQPSPAPQPAATTPAAAPAPATADVLLKKEQLEQLVSPIALYPDDLLAQVMMASTYPLEVVEASRWLTANKNLKGKALQDAAEKQKWDSSVKGLMATPQVLDMMSTKLSWTKDLGDAVLAQQADVMDAVQALRARAEANKKLETTKEQKVSKKTENNKQVIVIESGTPGTVYVPYYDPAVVYGTWPYPAYPPYYYPPAYGYYPYLGTGIAFAAGIALGAWGANHWGGNVNWNNNNININNNRNRVTHWNHNPAHRQGVRYNNSKVAQQFGKGDARRGAEGRNDFRGHDRPGGGDRPGAGNRPGGDRPGGGQAGNRPGGGDRPGGGAGAGNRPGGGGSKPSAGNRPGGSKPSAGTRPSGGGGANRPASRPSGGNAFAQGGGGRQTISHSSRGHASIGGRGGGGHSFGGGGRGGGFAGGGGRGGGGRGGGGGRRSDIVLKHDVTWLGWLDSGIGLYRFAYNGSTKPYVGVIAQDVQALRPDAVTRGADGYLRVHYEKIGVQFQSYDQWLATRAAVSVNSSASRVVTP